MKNILSRTALFVLALATSGCTGAQGYFRAEDAPAHVVAGMTDGRVCLTRMFGDTVAILGAAKERPEGPLLKVPGFVDTMERTSRPFDVMLVRSADPVVQQLYPTYFTHSVVWLGSRRQLVAEGLWGLPEMAPFRADIEAGKTIIESSWEFVRQIKPREALSDDDAVLLRPQLSFAEKRAVLRRMANRIGTRFDVSFDAGDKTRLTCIEFVTEVMPRLEPPLRYSQGRYAIIPDDVVREALEGRSPARIVGHWQVRDGQLRRLRPQETLRVITAPLEKPPYAFY